LHIAILPLHSVRKLEEIREERKGNEGEKQVDLKENLGVLVFSVRICRWDRIFVGRNGGI